MRESLNKEEKKKIFTVKSYVTAGTLENIIIDAFDYGGIGYWAKCECSSDALVDLVIRQNKSVAILSQDDSINPKYELSLDRLLKGIELNAKNRPFDSNLDNTDADTVDCIIQYAIFNEIIFE